MEQIKKRFEMFKERNPYWSSFTCFANAITGKEYGKIAIGLAFRKLVEKDDYSKSDRDEILEGLYKL